MGGEDEGSRLAWAVIVVGVGVLGGDPHGWRSCRSLDGLNLLQVLKGEHLGFLSACPGVSLQRCLQSSITTELTLSQTLYT